MKPEQFTWADAQTEELLAMVDKHAKPENNDMGSTVVDFRKWACPALDAFMLHVLDVLVQFPEKGDLLVFAVVTKQAGFGWAPGYPHSHTYAHYSLIHYLASGDADAPLVVYEDDENSLKHIVQPVAGLTVVFEGRQLHGVLDNCGTRSRIALVVQNVPQGMQVDAPNWKYG